jgi:hypothetical protein
MDTTAAEAARRLAEVLVGQQSALDSDDLETVSAAMTAVRTAARELESALVSRGWGGGVLYGFGEPADADDDPDEAEDLDDSEDDEDEDEEQRPQPAGIRMTYQARHDYVVTDDEALATYVAERMSSERKSPWTAQEVADHGVLMMLAQLDGMGRRDYSAFGLVYAGGQDASHEIPRTLWEMGFEEGDDQFPTATP